MLINKPSRKKKKQDVINETLGLIKSVIQNDPTKEVLSYLKDESEKAREHELKILQLLTQSSSTVQTQQPYNMQNSEYTQGGSSQAWSQCNTQMFQSPNQENRCPYGYYRPNFS